MKQALAAHQARPLRVHGIAHDFELLDVWKFDVASPDPCGLSPFMSVMEAATTDTIKSHGATGVLFRLRGSLGRLFHWDHESSAVAVPEESLRRRLSSDEAAAQPWSRSDDHQYRPLAFGGFQLVYQSEEEALLEIGNATVHALLHISWVRDAMGFRPYMAVYAKKKGWLGRFYMAAIKPFRHTIVYPEILRAVRRTWDARNVTGVNSN